MKRILTTLTMIAAGTAMAVAQTGFDNLPDPVEDVNKVIDNTPGIQ